MKKDTNATIQHFNIMKKMSKLEQRKYDKKAELFHLMNNYVLLFRESPKPLSDAEEWFMLSLVDALESYAKTKNNEAL